MNFSPNEIWTERIDVNKTSASKECEVCHYWFFKDIGFIFEEHVCNRCHDLLVIAYSLKDIAILNGKENTYRCILMGISNSKNEGLERLNNSVTYHNILYHNKIPIEIIKEGAFGGTYFRGIYLILIKNGIEIHGKNLFI